MRYERVQKGNPHGLTVRQHVFPVASIRRFADSDGCVDLFVKFDGSTRRARPLDEAFVVRRRWDQKSEAGYMTHFERDFQTLATHILDGSVPRLERGDSEVAERFLALWALRSHFAHAPPTDIVLSGIEPSEEPFTADEREGLERSGMIFSNPDGTIPARFMAGLAILRNIDRRAAQAEGSVWGIVRSSGTAFLVPDAPFAAFIPISPTLMIIRDSPNITLSFFQVAELNADTLRESVKFCFARRLSACPSFRLGSNVVGGGPIGSV